MTNLTTSEVMFRGGAAMFNVSEEGVVFPFTRYSFRVESCNKIGCSEPSQESDVRQTNQDSEFLKGLDQADLAIPLRRRCPF